MRKYIRKMLKYTAEHQGVKASKFIKERFDKLQVKKYGAIKRDIYKAISTRPRRAWKHYIKNVVEFHAAAGKYKLN